MKQQTRELLVTTKAAENWKDNFDQKVDELIAIVSKVDNEKQVMNACEILDVYQKSQQKTPRSPKKKKSIIISDRPFEFMVFRN